jgi:hypothetical protein
VNPFSLVTLLALQSPADLLGLGGGTPAAGMPAEWKVRRVSGMTAPTATIRNDSAGRVLRLEGTGRAAWFYRELAVPVSESPGTLAWSWRVLTGPVGADLRVKRLDDSPMRVFVVFGGTRGAFGRSGRIIFYSVGGQDPAGYAGASHAGDRFHVVRMDDPADPQGWQAHRVTPFADYRRVWGGDPPAITAIGLMQDSDQTRSTASAEIRSLTWTPP